MSWVRYDDQFYGHPKVVAVCDRDIAALGLHVRGNTWSATTKRPGFIPVSALGFLVGSKRRGMRLAKILDEEGLWDWSDTDGGWFYHDWLDYASPDLRAQLGDTSTTADLVGDADRPKTLSEKRRDAGREGGRRAAAARRRDREVAARATAENDGGAVPAIASAVANGPVAVASAAAPEPGATQDASQSEALATPPNPSRARGGVASATATKRGAAPARTPGEHAAQEDWPRPPIGHHVDPHPPAVLEEAPSASHNGSRVVRATDASSRTATAQRLVTEWAASHPKQPTKTSRRWMANAVGAQLADGESEADVRAGLAALRAAQDTGADVGPGLLAKFIDQAKNPPTRQGQPNGQRLGYDPNATVSYGNDDQPGSTPMTIDEWRNERA